MLRRNILKGLVMITSVVSLAMGNEFDTIYQKLDKKLKKSLNISIDFSPMVMDKAVRLKNGSIGMIIKGEPKDSKELNKVINKIPAKYIYIYNIDNNKVFQGIKTERGKQFFRIQTMLSVAKSACNKQGIIYNKLFNNGGEMEWIYFSNKNNEDTFVIHLDKKSCNEFFKIQKK